MGFPFEQLDVYKKSLDVVDHVENICDDLKGKISFSFQDQIRRAALSVPLNIAEGNGRWHVKDKQNFFWIARGSAFEMIPLLQILMQRSFLAKQKHDDLYGKIEVVAKMLTNLIKSVETINHA